MVAEHTSGPGHRRAAPRPAGPPCTSTRHLRLTRRLLLLLLLMVLVMVIVRLVGVDRANLDQGRTVRRGMIMSRRWARGWPRAPRRDGTASGGENPGLVAEQHLPDLLRTAADPFPSRISADRRTFPRVLVRSSIDDVDSAALPATLSRPRESVASKLRP